MEKNRKAFQMENDKILAESINDHETAMFLQEETDRVLAESINNLKRLCLYKKKNKEKEKIVT